MEMERKIEVSRVNARQMSVARVLGYTDDLELGCETPAKVEVELQPLADGVLARPEAPRRGLAHDDYGHALVRLRHGHIAAADDRDAQRLEVAGRDRVPEHLCRKGAWRGVAPPHPPA